MTPVSLSFGIASYAAGALGFLAVLALVLPPHPGTRRANGLVAVLAISALWAAALSLSLYAEGGFRPWMLVLDAARATALIGYIASVLRARSDVAASVRLGNLLAVAALVLFVLAAYAVWSKGAAPVVAGGQTLLLSLLALPLVGLLGLEQLFRNSGFEQRAVVKPLCLGIGVAFVVDVFVYSQALLFLDVSLPLWLLRGVANVAVAPLLLMAAKRQADWGRDIFVSRHVVFYTTTLTAAGLYLLAMSVGGFLIAASGGTWGLSLQITFFVAAGAVLLYALFSVSVRRRLKVFIAKHFYRNRYDYREEWLRLVQTLAGRDDEASLPERSVKALGAIVGSARGELWMAARDGKSYEPYGTWRMASGLALSTDSALVRFLETTRWIVDTKEYLDNPEKYSNAFAADPGCVASPSIFVPLTHDGRLAGIVRLERPAGLGALGYEDHDLLKTAGQQVAIFLEQERAQEALSETRQFEAFSRLTAFLMHDLKNLIAQQELVVGNAQRFKHRPEFIEDAVRTIESGVQRMKKVLERLQSGGPHDHTSLVRVDKLLEDVCEACAGRPPAPVLGPVVEGARVTMDRDRLAMAVTHAVRNAQDATSPGGRIELRLFLEGGSACIEVEDTGSGMDPQFIRDHLFKPFHSTKGAKGMGIGAYQIRETLRAAGGDVVVRSEVGKGTTVRMTLPLAEAPIRRSAGRRPGAVAPSPRAQADGRPVAESSEVNT